MEFARNIGKFITEKFKQYEETHWEVKVGLALDVLGVIAILAPVLTKDPAYGVCSSTLLLGGTTVLFDGARKS